MVNRRRQRQVCEFKSSPVYSVSFRAAKAVHRNSVLGRGKKINMANTAYRRRDLFGLMVPAGLRVHDGREWQTVQQEWKPRAHLLDHKQEAETANWKWHKALKPQSLSPVLYICPTRPHLRSLPKRCH